MRSPVLWSEFSPRRHFIVALLATTAAATLLGGCNQTGLFAEKSDDFSAANARFADASDPQAAASATTQWALAYARKPNDPRMAAGYAQALRASGEKDQALQVLQAAYKANPEDGQLASELGRLALDAGRLDIANYALQVAQAKGVNDWKTLSAEGTLRAKQGQHQEAQQYFLAALKQQPDAVPVINNLALSYASDGQAQKAEELLRKAVASGDDDKRVRQNLALVLGLEGKFGEARQMASLDMPQADVQANVSYLRDMVDSRNAVASADDNRAGTSASDWQPFTAGSSPNPPSRGGSHAAPVASVQSETKPKLAEAAPAAKSFKTAAASELPPSTAKGHAVPTSILPGPFTTVVIPEVPATAGSPASTGPDQAKTPSRVSMKTDPD